ncbi:MAG: O-antigen polysaccharide polymerase Wzy [Ruminococcaceae bacterium]|nr:O-antigen polysaccharide polymerase Wzy [Oscillospiraceae bacterium]
MPKKGTLQGKHRETVLIFLSYVLCSALLILGKNNFTFRTIESYYRIFSYFSLALFVMQIVHIKWLGGKALSLAGLFLLLTNLYHFGAIWCVGLFNYRDFAMGFFFSPQYNNLLILRHAASFSFDGSAVIGLGLLWTMRNVPRRTVRCPIVSTEQLWSLGKWMFIITFPFRLFADAKGLYYSILGNYLDYYKNAVGGYVQAIGEFSICGALLMMIACRKKKNIGITIYLLSIFYCFICMFIGNRGHWLIYIILFTYLAARYFIKFRAKQVIAIVLTSFLCICFLNTIRETREATDRNMHTFTEEFASQLTEKNAVLGIVSELGNTFYTAYLSMQKVPQAIPYAYGSSYLKGFISVLPNWGESYQKIYDEAYFVKLYHVGGIGGSVIGEAYHNFGDYGLIMLFLISLLVGRVSLLFDDAIKRRDYLLIAYLVPLFTKILWWPRDSFASIPRPFVWGFLFVWGMSSLLETRAPKKKE